MFDFLHFSQGVFTYNFFQQSEVEEKFIRFDLKRKITINLVLERDVRSRVALIKPEKFLNLYTRIPKQIPLKRPRFEFNLERIGER